MWDSLYLFFFVFLKSIWYDISLYYNLHIEKMRVNDNLIMLIQSLVFKEETGRQVQ